MISGKSPRDASRISSPSPASLIRSRARRNRNRQAEIPSGEIQLRQAGSARRQNLQSPFRSPRRSSIDTAAHGHRHGVGAAAASLGRRAPDCGTRATCAVRPNNRRAPVCHSRIPFARIVKRSRRLVRRRNRERPTPGSRRRPSAGKEIGLATIADRNMPGHWRRRQNSAQLGIVLRSRKFKLETSHDSPGKRYGSPIRRVSANGDHNMSMSNCSHFSLAG